LPRSRAFGTASCLERPIFRFHEGSGSRLSGIFCHTVIRWGEAAGDFAQERVGGAADEERDRLGDRGEQRLDPKGALFVGEILRYIRAKKLLLAAAFA
jgi:hypothetical protein